MINKKIKLTENEEKAQAICEKFKGDFVKLLKDASTHKDIMSMKDEKEKMTARIFMGSSAIRIAAGMMLASVPEEAAEHFIDSALKDAREMNKTVKEAANMLEMLLGDRG